MPRVSIELPPAWAFHAELPVRITDINYGGHLGNDALLGLLQEARVRWLGRCGWTEKLGGHVGLIMLDASVRFLAEGRYGDVLTVLLSPVDWTRAGFDLVYLVRRQDGVEVARARTGFAFFDYSARKVARMPAGFREQLGC